jgi:anti-sigma B factor antagonist
MTIQERIIGSVMVLDISGRLVLDDGETALKSKVSALVDLGVRQVVLNVSEVSYVDSAGLGALVSSFLAAKRQGLALRLINPSARLLELLSMAKLLPIVQVCQSEALAIASFTASPQEPTKLV